MMRLELMAIFAFVNASYTPGEFYRRRVSNLCSNQVYRFSAWILNIHRAGANLLSLMSLFRLEVQVE